MSDLATANAVHKLEPILRNFDNNQARRHQDLMEVQKRIAEELKRIADALAKK